MKVSQLIFTSLLCLFGIGFVYSQDDSKKDKSKDNKSVPKPIEVKANLMILEADGKFADIKLEDLKIFEDGAEQKITYLAKKENALNVGFVIDNTGSMRLLLEEITKAASILVANLEATDEAFVVRFVDSDNISVIQKWTSNKAELKSALENMYVEGGQSAITDALHLSAEEILEREKQDKSKRYALILISDGEERDSYFKFEEMLALLKGTDIQIFMLSYANFAPKKPNESVKFSNRVAFETGSIVRILTKKKTKEEIIDALKAIVGELRSNYIVGYSSTNQKRDGLPRKLTVQIADGAKGEKRQAFIRESFIVPEEKNK